MTRRTPIIVTLALAWMLLTVSTGLSADREIGGVNFPGEKTVAGKQLKLNGVALR